MVMFAIPCVLKSLSQNRIKEYSRVTSRNGTWVKNIGFSYEHEIPYFDLLWVGSVRIDNKTTLKFVHFVHFLLCLNYRCFPCYSWLL